MQPDASGGTLPEIDAAELERLHRLAAQNAQALGLTAEEWERRRRAENPLIADILMAVDPRPSSPEKRDGPKGSVRPLRKLRIDELVAEVRDARRMCDAGRLRQLLDEFDHRKSRGAVRLAASVRLSLLVMERPDDLPFRIS